MACQIILQLTLPYQEGVMPALDQSTIQSVATIPILATLEKGRQMLNKPEVIERSNVLILIPEFGAIDDDDYAALIRANLSWTP